MLILGRPGTGKSDLALRIVDAGGELVADDLVRIHRAGSHLVARAPAMSGSLALRGLGLVDLPHRAESPLDLVIELRSAASASLLPEPAAHELLGLALPMIGLDPDKPGALARLRLLVGAPRRAVAAHG